MRKILPLLLAILILFAGCGQLDSEIAESEVAQLNSEIEQLQAKKARIEERIAALKAEETEIKTEQNIFTYFVSIRIAQSHSLFDPNFFENSLKDSINAITIEIPVSEEFYDEVEVGTILNNDFRFGSFILNNSIGSWSVRITNKRCVIEGDSQ